MKLGGYNLSVYIGLGPEAVDKSGLFLYQDKWFHLYIMLSSWVCPKLTAHQNNFLHFCLDVFDRNLTRKIWIFILHSRKRLNQLKKIIEKLLRIQKRWEKNPTKQGIPLKTEDMNYINRWTTMMYVCEGWRSIRNDMSAWFINIKEYINWNKSMNQKWIGSMQTRSWNNGAQSDFKKTGLSWPYLN